MELDKYKRKTKKILEAAFNVATLGLTVRKRKEVISGKNLKRSQKRRRKAWRVWNRRGCITNHFKP